MKRSLNCALVLASMAVTTQLAAAEISLYENEGFRGRVLSADGKIANFDRGSFNDRASSAIVASGRWEVCDDAGFHGRCVILRPGSYDSLKRMGLNDRISSVRPADQHGHYDSYSTPEPLAAPAYEYRRRPHEHITEVPVESVHAVVGPPDQRCWVDREQVSGSDHHANVGGAVVGAVIGGILGHQVGSGTGKDIATVGGAVAGGAVGSQVGRDRNDYSRDVRHCETVADRTPDYWVVTYDYQGVQHRVETSEPPGRTIAVNQHGDPRG